MDDGTRSVALPVQDRPTAQPAALLPDDVEDADDADELEEESDFEEDDEFSDEEVPLDDEDVPFDDDPFADPFEDLPLAEARLSVR